MNIIQSILLGIVQGLTEFLPVSSSGHLVLVPHLLGWEIPADEAFAFDVLVQVATLVGVFAYFWRDLVSIITAFIQGLLRRQPFEDPQARLGWYLILATIPAGLFGLTIKEALERGFSDPISTAIQLLITAAMLVVAERVGRRNRGMDALTWKDALWMGAWQAIAALPGISRSGATITGGMIANLERPAAARFSFLMSIPVMLAAGLLATFDLLELPAWGRGLGSSCPASWPQRSPATWPSAGCWAT
jgi:undecaprenyl-diphosphatase